MSRNHPRDPQVKSSVIPGSEATRESDGDRFRTRPPDFAGMTVSTDPEIIQTVSTQLKLRTLHNLPLPFFLLE
jgi:hypothetical protein